MPEPVAKVVKRQAPPIIAHHKNGRQTGNGKHKIDGSQTTPLIDPFEWGWREVKETLSDGRVIEKRIPLTLEDMLHPREGNFHMEELID